MSLPGPPCAHGVPHGASWRGVQHKRLLDGGIGAMPKVLEAYMGEAAWPTEPTRGRMAWPPWALAQRGGIVA